MAEEARLVQPVDGETFLIDLAYQGQPEGVGVYLLVDEHPALVDVGPTPNLPPAPQWYPGRGPGA